MATQPKLALKLEKIAQIALGVHDLEACKAFYRDVLGLPLMFEAGGMAFFECAGTRLMLGPSHHGKPPQGDAYLYFDAGPDWNQTEQALESRGVVFAGPAEVVQRAPGKEHALRFFKDPEGHALAIMGWRAA